MRGVEKQRFLIGLFPFLHPFVIFSTYHLFKRNRFQLLGDKMQINSVFVRIFHRGKIVWFNRIYQGTNFHGKFVS